MTFSGDQLVAMEQTLLERLGFELIYTTPYDYIDPFFHVFPWFKGLKKAIAAMVDIAITIPTLENSTSEELFHGALLACFKIRKCTLTPLQQKVLAAQIDNHDLAFSRMDVVVEEYNIALAEAEAMTAENQQDSSMMDVEY